MRETMWSYLQIGHKPLLYRKNLLYTILISLIIATSAIAQTPAFPGAEGFGKYATGGRGGAVYKVTNLNNSGPGSLREAVQASGPRTVIFEVSGIINLTTNLEVNNDHLTIAGQTAPGDGICISGAAFIVKASDVVVRYIRFRLGDNGYKDENGNIVGSNGPDVDTVGVYGSSGKTTDVIFDHCSMSWSIDEIIGMYGSSNPAYGVDRVTFQYCIFSEALWQSHHSDGSHSMSFLMNNNVDNVSIYKNLFSSSRERHIRAGGGCSFEMINNVVYDFKYTCVISAANEFTMIGNHYKDGTQNISGSYVADFTAQNGYNNSETKAYVLGNTNNAGLSEVDTAFAPYIQPTPPINSGIIAEPSATAITDVLANAGAILPQRDEIDTRIINNYNTNQGGVINTQAEVGGYPTYNSTPPPADSDNDGMPDNWEINNGLNPNDASDRNIVQPDGYTNLEYYLNDMTLTNGSVVNAGADVEICSGESTTLTATGAIAYLWSTGATSASITVSPIQTTTYTVTGTDAEGNTTQDTVTVTVNSLPTAFAGTDQTICAGESVTLTASGGDTYLWSNGSTSSSIVVSPTETTIYEVTVTENGCEDTDQVTVNVNPSPTANAGADVTINEGESTTLTAQGGGTYLWSTGETTQSITVSPTSTTTYTVTVTLNGCEDEDQVTVFVSSPVVADAGPDQTICSGESATLTASGGTEYQWSTGETTTTISVSPTQTTTYTVTVSDGNTTDTDEVTVFVNPSPTAYAGEDVTIQNGESKTLMATGGDTYVWSTGETTQSITVSPTSTTTYTVDVYNNYGCQDQDEVTVFVESNLNANAGPDVQICEDTDTTLTATGGVSYLWSTGATTASITVSPAETTTFTVTVYNEDQTDSDSDSVTVFVNPTPHIYAGQDETICVGQSINLTAIGSDNYTWSTGETTDVITVSPTETTTYTVTSTYGQCSNTDEVTVFVNEALVADAGEDISICEGGTVTLSASGGTTYEWSSGQITNSITVSPNQTTTYTVTVSNGSCSDTDQVTVFVNPNPTANAGADQNITSGETVTLTANGGGTYLWNTGETTQSITVSPTTTTEYIVTVNLNGCQDTDEVLVIVDNEVVADAGDDQTICEGESATLTATGGDNFEWSTGETTQSITVSPTTTTTYSVVVSSGNNSDTATVTVNVNPIPNADAGADQSICAGESITLTAAGGTSYEWSTGHTTQSIQVSPNATTTYSVIVSDNGCSSEDNVTVTVNQNPTADAGEDVTICNGESAQLSALGGSEFLWSTGETTQTINVQPNTTTTYNVTVFENGCESQDQVTVTVNPTPNANAGADVTINAGESTTLSASGGDSFLWSTGETTSIIEVSPLQTTTYTVTVSSNGCEATDEVTVFVENSDVVVANAGEDQFICQGDITILTASGGDTYLWSTGETTASIEVSPMDTTTYSVTVSTDNGSDTDEVTVFVGTTPNVTVSNNATIMQGEYITISAAGADSYQWSNGATQANIAVNPSVTTTYFVTGYINNCYETEDVTITVLEPVEATVTPDQEICKGENITLTASGGDTYLWSTGQTTQSIEVSPEEDTLYTVEVSNAIDTDSAQVMITVANCSTEDGEEETVVDDFPEFDYQIYHDSGDDRLFYAKVLGLRENAQFTVHNIRGTLIHNEFVNHNNGQRQDLEFRAHQLSSGVYIFTIKEKFLIRSKKIVIR